ncbi:endonuclease/exonuclease/phosphatase family protein [Pseudotenacibaculum sp. MALMAid0570]|uniref:endonuclease/exonuclease/phosphatase family protein n=1 Tax=Pseudotenacibaculum sp. MALMAid0570 TaxID=3143938 RepID=UPI0032DFD03A
MPYYKPLKRVTKSERLRTIAGIQRIREQLEAEKFPTKKATESLILGTWNIRNFDDDRFNFGPRLTESFYYLAEIISRFDVIAIQEVCADLWPLDRLLKIVGRNYDYIMTDVTHSSLGGNNERLGFIYNKNKVRFTGVAGEIVLPDKLLISDGKKNRQFSRTPFGVTFQSGWFKFQFSTVHIYFGSNQGNTPQYERRVKEIDTVARYIAKEAKNSDANHILVGDFNIKAKGSDGYNALKKRGFKVVSNRVGSNKDQTKFYDQISFLSRKNELELVEPKRDDRVVQFFNSVFREEDYEMYKPVMLDRIKSKIKKAENDLAEATSKTAKNKLERQIVGLKEVQQSEDKLKSYYEKWKTFQVSDHLPLWVEIKVDFSDEYLEYLKKY